MIAESTKLETNSEVQGPPPRRSSRWPFLFMLIALVVASTIVACRDRQSTPTAPSEPQATWPVVAAPAMFSGLTITYPPDLQPTVVDEWEIRFGGGPIQLDTDTPATISIEYFPHSVDEEIAHIKNFIDAIQVDSVDTFGAVQARHIIGRLNYDYFGWGGTAHGYFVFARGSGTVVVSYDAENPEIAADAMELLRRTLSK